MKCVLAFLFVPGVGKTSEPSFWAWEVGRSTGTVSPVGLSLPSGCSLCSAPGSKEWDGAGEAGGTGKGLGVGPSASFWTGLTFQLLPQSCLSADHNTLCWGAQSQATCVSFCRWNV